MDDTANDWHEYTVTGTAVPYSEFTLEDIQLALLQQSAPECRDLRIQDLGHVDKWRTQSRIDAMSMNPR